MARAESQLSKAELRVLARLLEGERNREIARRLRLSEKTVKNHIAHILRKTRTKSRLELTIRIFKGRERELRRRLRAT
jgi:DNA-binding CsgD family transcriptional regulator